jgi:hypothetical protein
VPREGCRVLKRKKGKGKKKKDNEQETREKQDVRREERSGIV